MRTERKLPDQRLHAGTGDGLRLPRREGADPQHSARQSAVTPDKHPSTTHHETSPTALAINPLRLTEQKLFTYGKLMKDVSSQISLNLFRCHAGITFYKQTCFQTRLRFLTYNTKLAHPVTIVYLHARK